MSILELDDLLADLEKSVEKENDDDKCASARLSDGDMGTAESNTYAHNNTSHLSPKGIGSDQTQLGGSNNRTSANSNQDFLSSSKQFTSSGSKMTSASVSAPGPGGPTGVRQNLNELDVLLEDLSKARFSEKITEQRTETVSSSSYTETSTKLGMGITHPKTPRGIGVGDMSDAVIREMQETTMTERRSTTETNQQLGMTNGATNGHRTTPPPPPPARQYSPMPHKTAKNEMISSTSIGSIKSQRSISSNDGFGQGASSATQELDDLMTRLDTFKLPQGPQEEPVPTNLDNMLVSLQENMDKEGIRTTQKGVCSSCQKPIVGQVITALGKTFHPEHFVCHHCNQELGTRNFFERDGVPFCETDYHLLFSPRCAACDGAILDKCVSALDKTWHPEHFVCAGPDCGKPFGDDGFHERDGKAYCPDCYFSAFAPRCGGCSSPITDNYISSLDRQWHPTCFVCAECREPFTDGNFFVHEERPYCETHYHALRGSLCAGCGKPISGRCITAMFRKFHPEHFVCSFCLKQLNKGTFKEQGEKPYCHGCYDRLFG